MNPLFLDEAGATREALEDAKRNLRHELEFAVDPVPCPECGHYQEDMIVPAQQQFLAAWTPRGFWISGCAIPAFLLSVSLSQSFLQNETGEMLVRVSAGVFFLGLAIVAGRWFAAVFHDPNQRSAEVRRATGREYAVTRAAFEAANPGIELPHFGARPITDITTRVPLP